MTERNWRKDWISLASITIRVSMSRTAYSPYVNQDLESPELRDHTKQLQLGNLYVSSTLWSWNYHSHEPDFETSTNMQTSFDWQHVNPQGMEKIVTYIKERYNNIPMFITENGKHNSSEPFSGRSYSAFLSEKNKMSFRVCRIWQPKFHWGPIP